MSERTFTLVPGVPFISAIFYIKEHSPLYYTDYKENTKHSVEPFTYRFEKTLIVLLILSIEDNLQLVSGIHSSNPIL